MHRATYGATAPSRVWICRTRFDPRVRRALTIAVILAATVSLGSARPAIAHDATGTAGWRILYSSDWSGVHQIYAVDPSRRATTGQLTFGAGGATSVTPAPNGRRIAYLGNQRSLFLARANGSSPRRLAADDVTQVRWSPDSSQLAYERALRLHVVRADGSHDRVVRRAPRWAVVDPDVSPDGRWKARSSSNFIEVSSQPPKTTYPVERERIMEHTWSPDSRYLAIASSIGIDVLNVRTGRTRSLTRTMGHVLRWAPDARSVAFVGGRGQINEELFESGDLQVVTLAGRLSTTVEQDRPYGGRIVDLAWTRPPAGIRYRKAEADPADGLVAGGPIDRLAADGGRVAFSACQHVYAWTPASGEITALGHTVPLSSCFYRTNTVVHSLAVAGNRVGYGERSGCNSITVTLNLEVLAPVRTSTELARNFSNCAAPNRPAGHRLTGSGALLVFSMLYEPWPEPGEQCCHTILEEIKRVDANGCPCPVIASSPGPLAPADVDDDRIVARGDNATLVLDRDGRQLLSVPVSPVAAQLSGRELVLLLRGQLLVYDAATGALERLWPLPDVPSGGTCDLQCWRGGQTSRLWLQDLAHGLVAYVIDGNVHLLRLADGADAIVARGTTARFMDAGLVYADGARLHLVPFDRLPLR